MNAQRGYRLTTTAWEEKEWLQEKGILGIWEERWDTNRFH
jgi:hypothetical protein